MNDWSQSNLGYFGNIWVRQNLLSKAGDENGGGHKHAFDHISLLTSGKLKVEVEGHEPKEFKAPTFIVIRKEQKHKFIALEDNTVWFCVFALRDLDGEVIDNLYGNDNDPMSLPKKIHPNCSTIVYDYEKRRNELDAKTTEFFDADKT